MGFVNCRSLLRSACLLVDGVEDGYSGKVVREFLFWYA